MDLNYHGDAASARLHASKGLGFGPGSDLSDRISLVNTEIWSGHEQANLDISKELGAEVQKRLPDTSQFFYSDNKLLGEAWLQFSLPDYHASSATWLKVVRDDPSSEFIPAAPAMAATAYALDHELEAARSAEALAPDRDETSYMWNIADGAFTALPRYWIPAEAGNWAQALADVKRIDAWLEAGKAQRPIDGLMQKVWIWPLEALALARTGDVAGAQALISRVRGQVAAAAHDWPGAERWFAEAMRQGPSLPFAYADWGQLLLARGDPDGAIAELELAQEKGPHFADPLET